MVASSKRQNASSHAPTGTIGFYTSAVKIQIYLLISLKNRFIGGSETTSFGAKDFTFSLWAVSNDTTIEREVRLNVDNDDGDGDGSPKC